MRTDCHGPSPVWLKVILGPTFLLVAQRLSLGRKAFYPSLSLTVSEAMASADTIMQLALIEAAVVPFPGVHEVLKGKEDNSIRTKVIAVQKLLGLKEGTKKDEDQWSTTAQAVLDWKLEHPGELIPRRSKLEQEKAKVNAEAKASGVKNLVSEYF